MVSRSSFPASDFCPQMKPQRTHCVYFSEAKAEKFEVFLNLVYLVVTKPFSCLKLQNFRIKTLWMLLMP